MTIDERLFLHYTDKVHTANVYVWVYCVYCQFRLYFIYLDMRQAVTGSASVKYVTKSTTLKFFIFFVQCRCLCSVCVCAWQCLLNHSICCLHRSLDINIINHRSKWHYILWPHLMDYWKDFINQIKYRMAWKEALWVMISLKKNYNNHKTTNFN